MAQRFDGQHLYLREMQRGLPEDVGFDKAQVRSAAAIRVPLLPQKGQFVLERLQAYQTVASEIVRQGE